MAKINKNNNEKQKKSLLLEQDLRLIKGLAGNDKKVREKILKNLKKWFEHRSSKIPFTKEDFIRMWKGLFYSMWMADKPLVQEECAENIANLIHFPNPQTSLLFFKCSLIVLTTEWFGIDQLRLDKFLMFVRRILRQTFEVLKNHQWDEELIAEFSDILSETVLKAENTTYLGLTMHITEIYLEELAKVSNGEIEKRLVVEFIKPFTKQLSKLNDSRQINHLQKYMFHHLLNQSDEGIEYQVKFQAWKDRGFPGGTIEALEKIEKTDEDDEEEEDDLDESEKPLDPRAGRVDVSLPQLPFNASELTQLLLDHRFSEGSTTKARKTIIKLANEFKKLSEGDFPLGIKEVRMPDDPSYSTSLKKSVNRLVKFEKKLLEKSNKKQKKKRKVIEIETDENGSDEELFKDKLEKFIKNSEGSVSNGDISKKKKLKLKNEKNVKNLKNKLAQKSPKHMWSYEESFQRNSGVWFVEKLDSDDDSNLNESASSNSPNGQLSQFDQDTEQLLKKKSPKNKSLNGDISKKSLRLSSQLETKEVLLNEKSPKKRKLCILDDDQINISHSTPKFNMSTPFPQSEWDMPAKGGEVEIFVPSNKYKEKMKKLAKKTDKTLEELIGEAIGDASLKLSKKSPNGNKKKLSLDVNVVRNPFSRNSVTPRGEKKVKIDLKLNKSQEIHEHRAQLRNSPAIPYDANKKPLKPLLKPNAIASPINPFYKRKLKLTL